MKPRVNIPLPYSLAIEIKELAKEEKFTSTSEFVKHLLRFWNTEKLLKDLKQSEEEITQGKGMSLKSFNSLRDLV